MGIKFDKVNPDKFSKANGMHIINMNEAGSVYLVLHKFKETSATGMMDKDQGCGEEKKIGGGGCKKMFLKI